MSTEEIIDTEQNCYTVNLGNYRGEHIDLSVGGNRVIGYIPASPEQTQEGPRDEKKTQIPGSTPEPEYITVSFFGTGNILYIEENEKGKMGDVSITFKGDDGIAYLSKNRHKYSFDATIEQSGTLWFGRDVFMNLNRTAFLNIHVGSGHMVTLGHDCLASTGVILDTVGSDAGPAGDIIVGNHVWLGQNVKITGSSTIDGNAIFGAGAVVDGKHITSNSVWITINNKLTKYTDNVVFGKDSIRNRARDKAKHFDKIDEQYLKEILDLSSQSLSPLQKSIKESTCSTKKLEVFRDYSDSFVYKRPQNKSIKKKLKETAELSENVIYGNCVDPDERANIVFKGHGNVLIFEKGARIGNGKLVFSGDRGLIFVGKSRKTFNVLLEVCSDSNLYLGKNFHAYEFPYPFLQSSENQTVLIGNNCRFGTGTWCRTSDQHPIWNIDSKKRINHGKSIFVGDGEVIAPHKMLFKGNTIGEMKGLFRRKYMYKKSFDELRSTDNMEERIFWMRKLSNSDSLSRFLRAIHLNTEFLGKKTIVDGPQTILLTDLNE